MPLTPEAEKQLARLDPREENDFKIDEDGLAFMKAQTGIEDEEELKKHILAVQAEAFAVSLAVLLTSSSVIISIFPESFIPSRSTRIGVSGDSASFSESFLGLRTA